MGLGLNLGIAHVSEIGEKGGSGRVPSEPGTGLCTQDVDFPPVEESEKAEMFLGLFRRNGNDGHIQAAADSGGDVFEGHTLFGDRVIPGSRCALREGKLVNAVDILHMRSGPAVATLADLAGNSLGSCHRDQ